MADFLGLNQQEKLSHQSKSQIIKEFDSGNLRQACSRSFGVNDLDCLEDDVSVFKLIGPSLVK